MLFSKNPMITFICKKCGAAVATRYNWSVITCPKCKKVYTK